jgi:hypothetical protein
VLRGLGVVKSDLEELFQAFLIDAGLPLPLTNVLIEGIEVDCVWPAVRLIVELDSRTHHDTADAFEADRARDRRLEAAGWRVVRITWRQLHDTRADVERDLRRLITAAPAPALPSSTVASLGTRGHRSLTPSAMPLESARETGFQRRL